MTLLIAIVGAVFGVERATRWINRRMARQTLNDEIWERVMRQRDEPQPPEELE